MCMAEANGVLYAACGIKDESPLSGGLFRRVDGEQPPWELLWRWPHKIQEQGGEMEIMRGLTAVPDPAGGEHEILKGTYARGRVFDPQNPQLSSPRGLVATRTIEVLPFPEDRGRVLYMGGFDCANIESHLTAWIYRAAMPHERWTHGDDLQSPDR